MDLRTVFEVSVERDPEKIAVTEKGQQLTFQQLDVKVNRVAISLQKLGLEKQDRVMVLLKNRLETVVLFWAIQKLGAIFTPINFRLSSKDIRHCVQDVEPKMVVFEESSRHLVEKEAFKERPIFIGLCHEHADIHYAELEDHTSGDFQATPISENDLSVLCYTSGTTNVPKGVPRTHGSEYAATMAHIVQCRYRMLDRTLGVYPLYHVIGLRSLLAMMIVNGNYAVLDHFSAYESLKMIEQEKLRSLFLTPTMYHDLLDHPTVYETDLTSVETIVFSGAPMSRELMTKCDEVFQPKVFANHYGSTEIYTFTHCPDVREKPNSAGKPGIHQHVRLVNPGRNQTMVNEELPVGKIGEIIISMKSPEAFKGYWNRPDATKLAIRNDWYFTGDIGYFDKDGDLIVVGRADDMILSGGENIYPQRIETILKEHPKVEDTVVIGEADQRWGQIVVAFIVADEEIAIQELDQFCKTHQQLSMIERPRKYVFISEIPKTATGKILRRQLRERYLNELEI